MKRDSLAKVETMLSANLSQDDFKELRGELTNCLSITLQTKYKLYKPIEAMIESIEVSNELYDAQYDDEINPVDEYDESAIIQLNDVYKASKLDSKATSLTQHIEDTAKKKVKKLYGAYIPLDKCWEALIARVKKALTYIPGGTMEAALDGAFIVMCADGAVHTALGKSRKGIITYSVCLVSQYIIAKLMLYPSSGNNIMVHCQLNGQETVANLTAVFQFRFKYVTINNIPIYDLGDAKLLYMILQYSHWRRMYH